MFHGEASTVEVKAKSERDYVYRVQDALRKRVWNAGCHAVSKSNYTLMTQRRLMS